MLMQPRVLEIFHMPKVEVELGNSVVISASDRRGAFYEVFSQGEHFEYHHSNDAVGSRPVPHFLAMTSRQ